MPVMSRDEKNATSRPSGLTAGEMLYSPYSPDPNTRRSPVSAGRERAATSGAYSLMMAARQRVESESDVIPSTLLMASSKPDDSEARKSRGTISSPHVPPTYAHKASPYRYGKY